MAKSKSKDVKVADPPKADVKPADEPDKSKAKDSEQLVKVVTKGGAAVDSLVPAK